MSATRWTCLLIQAPALTAIQRSQPDLPERLAIIDGPDNRSRILACTAEAGRHGVRPGLSIPAALALCPDLSLRKRDPLAEKALWSLLGQWAYGFSDQVVLTLPDAIVLETGGSLALFGGWHALERQLHADLAHLGIQFNIASAPRARAAWLLAHRHDGLVISDEQTLRTHLDQLSIHQAGLDESASARLAAMGFLRLKELAAIPRDSLGRRIGPSALQQLDRLHGRCPDPLPVWQPPDSFESVIEFDARPTAIEPILFALQRLLRELSTVLDQRDRGVQRLHILLLHEDIAPTRVTIGLLRAERDPERLLHLCRTRLEQVPLPAAIAGLALVCEQLTAFQPQANDLFQRASREHSDWPLLAGRLRARLGDDAVLTLHEGDDHRPERADLLAPITADDSDDGSRRKPARASNTPPVTSPRPVWLLPQPIPLRGAPTRILSGPERIESGWWDGEDVRRDYYIVETGQGRRAWAYCTPGQREGWMLHGWFA